MEGEEHHHHAAHVRAVGPGAGARVAILREQVRRFAAGDKLLSVVDFKKGILARGRLSPAAVQLGEPIAGIRGLRSATAPGCAR